MRNSYLVEAIQTCSDQHSEGELKLKVNGTSMSPFIKLGDTVFAKREPLATLAIGDVLVFTRENDIVTHRLVRIGSDGYYCKGDNTHIPDPVVRDEQIIGKVFAIERAGKRIALDGEGWKNRNRILGRFGNIEAQLYEMADRIRNRVRVNPGNKTHIFIGRIVFSPFRAIIRLISR
jgi:hypothetical protein